jgi:RNA polymerase primary sigma factor
MSRMVVTDEHIRAAQGGDGDAMWLILQAYEPMLFSVIRSVAPTAGADDAEDLLQEARAVLIQHVRDYDTETSSAQLHTYAHRAVRRAVMTEWTKSTTALTIEPEAARRVKHALWEHDGDLDKAWASLSADEDPRRRMSRQLFIATVEALAGAECLDAPLHDGTDGQSAGGTLADTIPDTTSDYINPLERRQLARWLMTKIQNRQSLALRAHYGIGMTQADDADVAADLGIKPAAVRQLRSRGVSAARAVAQRHDIAA